MLLAQVAMIEWESRDSLTLKMLNVDSIAEIGIRILFIWSIVHDIGAVTMIMYMLSVEWGWTYTYMLPTYLNS